ncbi:heme o synthase [Planctomicrobium piriforme]|uniref:Protoheme IX farnesyltransferase n=1 Tax=Planctomicrobium piriforme TaxID=1576369 RepID=A0A1I3CYK5_9PLAN|nr:heme o synthase [Planctomicrobium piriforme]SFH79572.1 protoheme IX farnesyltransferase [Planctomicrobium piriforme]
MNSLVTPLPRTTTADSAEAIDCVVPAARAGRLSAYFQLAKPRIALMVLLTVTVGYVIGSRGVWQPWPLLHACFGILLAVVASSSLNQLIERKTDARMPRTKSRPLPSARLSAFEVLVFALFCGVVSVVYLYFTVNPITAWLTLATIVLYALCYTPLKRYTSLCTVIGAVPGALPPVLGWAASGAPLDLGAFSLFAIMFVWQFPHFLAIAWLYRDQYEQAGLRMLPAEGRPGITGAISSGYALVLIPISLMPAQLGLTGDAYALVALVLGILYAWSAVLFQRSETRRCARRVLWTSLVYLPAILIALTLDHIRLMN